jgi:hypothetical protein
MNILSLIISSHDVRVPLLEQELLPLLQCFGTRSVTTALSLDASLSVKDVFFSSNVDINSKYSDGCFVRISCITGPPNLEQELLPLLQCSVFEWGLLSLKF